MADRRVNVHQGVPLLLELGGGPVRQSRLRRIVHYTDRILVIVKATPSLAVRLSKYLYLNAELAAEEPLVLCGELHFLEGKAPAFKNNAPMPE